MSAKCVQRFGRPTWELLSVRKRLRMLDIYRILSQRTFRLRSNMSLKAPLHSPHLDPRGQRHV